MDRSYYINLANSGLKMPIGTDLVLHQKKNYEDILLNGEQLGKVMEETARKYHTPLAFPLMDLMLEKSIMLEILGIPKDKINTYHFDVTPNKEEVERINNNAGKFLSPRMKADIEAVEYITKKTDLFPIGMSIGPVSLLTKLLADPISGIYIAASGVSAEEDEEVKMLETILELSKKIILSYIELKIKSGAKAVVIAEPAANRIFFSPRQIEGGSDIFERYVFNSNMQIKKLLDKHNVDLIFHCCGEITDYMLNQFVKLDPAILSLGSSRNLWEDAEKVPKNIVLFGNLPTKKFFSDHEISKEEVKEKSIELKEKMKAANHPFILGSECDVLSVSGCEHIINEKVDIFMHC